MFDYYKKQIKKKVWLLDEKYNLDKSTVYTIIGVDATVTDWGTKIPVYMLGDGTSNKEINRAFVSNCVFAPDNTLPEDEKVFRYLLDNEIYSEDVHFPHDDGELHLTINNGDWKHSHQRADWLLAEIGYQHLNTIQCGDSEEDNFDAIHIYRKENNE